MEVDGEPGFWVPRSVFVELTSALRTKRLREEQIDACRAEVRALRESLKLMTQTASTARLDRDLCRDYASQLARGQVEMVKSQPTDLSWLERAAWMALGGAVCGGAVALTR